MTAPLNTATAGATLHAALPARAQCHITRTRRFDHLAAEAFANGWTLRQLVARVGSGDLGVNPGGVITTRLEACANEKPPPDHSTVIVPFCSPACRERRGWVENDDGQIVGRCPCRTAKAAP